MSVEVSNLTKSYGLQKAVDDISFSVKKGEVLGFLGPNGAGKSTTMKILTGFIGATAGVAKVAGFDVHEKPLEVNKRVGYLPENNPLYLDMYVREYLQFVARIYRLSDAKQMINDVIERTGLQKEAAKRIGQLSKGYRQRVGLAQAIIHDPEVLILDEPTSGLDPNQLVEIRQLIKDLGKEKTVIFSTHIMQEVQAICDRVVIINNGKIVADGSIDMIRNFKKKEIAVQVEFSRHVNQNTLQKITEVKRFEKITDTKFIFYSDETVDLRPIIFDFAVEKSLQLIEMYQQQTSVEDVFQSLTK